MKQNCGESLRCAAHTLNLAVEDIFLDASLLGVLRQQCREITTFFNHSSSANADLLREQVASGVKMTKRVYADVRTRWNSSFLMMNVCWNYNTHRRLLFHHVMR